MVAMTRAKGQDQIVPREQSHFSAEDESVKRPSSLRRDVLSRLASDQYVAETLKQENLTADQLPTSWFLASEVHLQDAAKSDLVVMGTGPLLGANVTTFWVFGDTTHNLKMLLKATAHDLAIKPDRWKDYRNIEIDSITADRVSTVRFRFNGSVYTPY